MNNPKLSTLLVAVAVLASASACGTEDIPPGNKGYMFDRTGGLALYSGGSGLVTDNMLGPGTHYTGLYDEVRDVNCKDANARETIEVLTASDLTVSVDLRITYASDCRTKESLMSIFDQVQSTDGKTILPVELYNRYILPIVRESLRDQLAKTKIEEVKNVRSEIRNGIEADLKKSIKGNTSPVLIKILTVSDIRLPQEIIDKNKEIELARQEAEQEREKQTASKFRLERELFEAQEDRKVQVEKAERIRETARIDAERDKEVEILRADAQLEVEKREAEGIAAVRAQLTGPYIQYFQIMKDTEVRKEMATALGQGTKWYVGPEFLIPPDGNAKVAIGR